MNQSFDNTNYHLPPIPQNNSELKTKVTARQMNRSMSLQNAKPVKLSLTRKLVMMQDIRNAEQYDAMNEKDLLREHQKLLKVLKKFQEIIDLNLQKKQKAREKTGSKPQSSREDILHGQITNNKKIIQNYNKELKELQGLKKVRKLHEVIEEKTQVQADIGKLKKQIFNLKNQDNMAGRNLLADRGIIQKELKEHQKDLKIQLIKKQQYQVKIQQLTVHLAELKKDCQGLTMQDVSHQKSANEGLAAKIAQKRMELDQITRSYVNYEESIQENMVAKAKRNKLVAKQIQQSQKRIVELNVKIQKYKEKINRYQEAMEIVPSKEKNEMQAK